MRVEDKLMLVRARGLVALMAGIVSAAVIAVPSMGAGPLSSARKGTTTPTQTLVPVNTVLPVISGVVAAGQTITAGPGSWSNSPTSYSYAWQSRQICPISPYHRKVGCLHDTALVGTSSKIKLPPHYPSSFGVRVAVTATNAAGSSLPAISNTLRR